MADTTRAEDLVTRAKHCRLAEVTAWDLEQQQCSNEFCRFCTGLAGAIAGISQVDKESNSSQVQGGVNAVKRFGGSPQAANGGSLDNALKRLDRALDSSSMAQDRISILERLLAYLQAGRLIAAGPPPPPEDAEPMQIEQEEQPDDAAMQDLGEDAALASNLLRDMAALLGVASASSSQSAVHLLEQIQRQLQDVMQQLPQSFLEPLLPAGSLNDGQTALLEDIYKGLYDEYTIRRKMLVERAKVTLDSQLRSKQLEDRGTQEEARRVAEQGSARMTSEPLVTLQNVYQACQADLVPVSAKATSGDKGKFEASVKSVLIGKVPDRGGRPFEGRAAAAAASMPAWAPRQSDGGGRGGPYRGGGGRGGGRGRGKKFRGS